MWKFPFFFLLCEMIIELVSNRIFNVFPWTQTPFLNHERAELAFHIYNLNNNNLYAMYITWKYLIISYRIEAYSYVQQFRNVVLFLSLGRPHVRGNILQCLSVYPVLVLTNRVINFDHCISNGLIRKGNLDLRCLVYWLITTHIVPYHQTEWYKTLIQSIPWGSRWSN